MKKSFKRIIAILLTVIILASSFTLNSFAIDDGTGQNRIYTKTPVLDGNGTLTEPGYCFTNLYEYDRDAITAGAGRIKEWDFYQISNDDFTVQVTIADISLGGAVTVGFFDRKTGEKGSAMVLNLFTFGKFNLGLDHKGLAENDWVDHTYKLNKRNFNFELSVGAEERTLKFTGKSGGKALTMDITMDMLPDHESHFIALPFKESKPKQFYYNQKTNCMVSTGKVTYGDKVYEFKGLEDKSFAVLDWGRGVWPYHQVWWWGNGGLVELIKLLL